MIKLTILALSINPEILRTHFYESYITYMMNNSYDDLSINTVIYTQGFDFNHDQDTLKFIRDDTMYNQGYSISEIRDYFTSKVINDCDYILNCDDDFKFRSNSLKYIYQDIKAMEKHLEVGLTCMHYHKEELECTENSSEYWYDFNPSRVATRSGILFKTKAYDGWGGEFKSTYFEECILATKIYAKGYEIKHTVSDTIHKTKSTGLGLSQERKYGKSNIPMTGRKIMYEQGLLTPSLDSYGNPRYDIPLKISDKLQKLHDKNKLKILKNSK